MKNRERREKTGDSWSGEATCCTTMPFTVERLLSDTSEKLSLCQEEVVNLNPDYGWEIGEQS